jgi:hypothetical protein
MHHSRLHTTKRVLARYTPALFRLIRASRRRLHARRNARLQGALTGWKAQFIERFDFVIQAGPFGGMQFHRSATADADLPLLIGSDEAETHGFTEQALAREPRIIVELHEFMRTDVAITPTVLARFSDTHDIQIASVGGRSAADYRCLDIFPGHIRARALHEDRVQYQQWAYLKARSRTV